MGAKVLIYDPLKQKAVLINLGVYSYLAWLGLEQLKLMVPPQHTPA